MGLCILLILRVKIDGVSGLSGYDSERFVSGDGLGWSDRMAQVPAVREYSAILQHYSVQLLKAPLAPVLVK